MADDLNKQYFDERIDELADQLTQTNGLLESFATATAQRFDRIDERFDEVDKRFDSLNESLSIEATNVDLLQKDVRQLRETIEDNVVPRLSNLESQV